MKRFLDGVDRLDVDAAMALMAPDARVLVAEGHRAEGTEAVRQLFGNFLGQLRSTTHRITAQWHQEDVWIAEVDASMSYATGFSSTGCREHLSCARARMAYRS